MQLVWALIGALLASQAQAGAAPLWGSLPKGSYAVGFRSQWQFDYSRTYRTTFEDKTSYGTSKSPRPILVNLWYPTDPSARALMRHRDYLEIASDDPALSKLASALVKYERDTIAQEMMHQPVDALKPSQQRVFEEFLDSPIACRRNAEPAPGKFPLVIYHSGFGSSFEDNAVLCEFLASHGFVVLGSAFQEPSGKSFNVDGQVTSGRDMDFLIAYVQQLPYVDWQHIGIVGHSGGAHAALMYRAQPSSAVDAVVSLDTTQDYYGLSDPRWERLTATVTKNRVNFTGPLLIVANPHAFFEMCDSLNASRRYYLTIKDLDHNDFISQGCLANELRVKPGFEPEGKPGQSSEGKAKAQAHAGAVRQGYEALCVYVLRFLEAELKGDKPAQEYVATQYRDTPLGGTMPHVEYLAPGVSGPPAYQEGDRALPTPRQLRPFLREHGVEKTTALLKRVRQENAASPLLHPVFAFALVSELLDQGKNQEARAFCQFFQEGQVSVVAMLLSMGDLYSRLGAKDSAASSFRKVLTLDPTNASAAEKLKKVAPSK